MIWPGSHWSSAGVAVNAAVNIDDHTACYQRQYAVSAGHRHGPSTTVDVTDADYQTYYVLAGGIPVLVHNCGGEPASSPRGLNNMGGVISEEGTNAAGGRIFTSTGQIAQNDFAGIVNGGLMRGDDVHILTGAHGFPDGSILPEPSMYADDVARFGGLPGVTVHDFPSMTPAEVQQVMRGQGTIIGGFCDTRVMNPGHGG